MDEIDRIAELATNEYSRQLQRAIANEVALYFRYSVRVTVRRPWWMPDWVYRRLMRTIIVEHH